MPGIARLALAACVLAVGLVAAFADDVVQVVGDPAVVGMPATLAAVVPSGGMEITGGTVGGMPVGTTPLDASSVMLSIPANVIQQGSNTLVLTSPTGTKTGTIVGTPPPVGTGGVVALFFADAEQIRQFTVQRIATARDWALLQIISARTADELASAKVAGTHGMDSARHDGYLLLDASDRLAEQLLQGLLEANPGRPMARAVAQARRQIETQEAAVRRQIEEKRNLEDRVVDAWFGAATPPSSSYGVGTAGLEIAGDAAGATAANPPAGPAINAAAAVGYALIGPGGPWTPVQYWMIAGLIGSNIAWATWTCPFSWTINSALNATDYSGAPPGNNFYQVSLTMPRASFAVVVDPGPSSGPRAGAPVTATPSLSVDVGAAPGGNAIRTGMLSGSFEGGEFVGSIDMTTAGQTVGTLLKYTVSITQGGFTNWQVILVKIVP